MNTNSLNTQVTVIPANVLNLLTRKGQFVSIHTKRPMKMKKGQPVVEKESQFVARIGVEFDNIKSVQEKRADGTYPEKNQGLPWGKWVVPNVLIEHKGEFYIRCTKGSNTPTKTKYLLGNTELDRDQVKPMTLSAEFSTHDDNEVFNIKVSSIIELKGV